MFLKKNFKKELLLNMNGADPGAEKECEYIYIKLVEIQLGMRVFCKPPIHINVKTPYV